MATVTRAVDQAQLANQKAAAGSGPGAAPAEGVDAVLECGRRRRQDGPDRGEEPPDGQARARPCQPEPGPAERHPADDRHDPPVRDARRERVPRVRDVQGEAGGERPGHDQAAGGDGCVDEARRGAAASRMRRHPLEVTTPWSAFGRSRHGTCTSRSARDIRPGPGATRAPCPRDRAGPRLDRHGRPAGLPGGPHSQGDSRCPARTAASTTAPTTAATEPDGRVPRRRAPRPPVPIAAAGLQLLVAAVTTFAVFYFGLVDAAKPPLADGLALVALYWSANAVGVAGSIGLLRGRALGRSVLIGYAVYEILFSLAKIVIWHESPQSCSAPSTRADRARRGAGDPPVRPLTGSAPDRYDHVTRVPAGSERLGCRKDRPEREQRRDRALDSAEAAVPSGPAASCWCARGGS